MSMAATHAVFPSFSFCLPAGNHNIGLVITGGHSGDSSSCLHLRVKRSGVAGSCDLGGESAQPGCVEFHIVQPVLSRGGLKQSCSGDKAKGPIEGNKGLAIHLTKARTRDKRDPSLDSFPPKDAFS